MISTMESLEQWPHDEFGPVVKLEGGIEIRFERLIYDGQWYLAVYKDQGLVAPKVVVKIGKETDAKNKESGLIR